jgi:hypothetical protein
VSHKRFTMLAPSLRSARISLLAPKPTPKWAYVGSVVIIFSCAMFALFAPDTAYRFAMGSIAVCMALYLLAIKVFSTGLSAGVVRIDPKYVSLRFVAAPNVALLILAIYLFGLLPGLAMLMARSGRFRLMIILVSLTAVAGIGQQVWGLTMSPGLTLTQTGLHGVRGSRRVSLTWADLDRAYVSAMPKQRLNLRPHSGKTIAVLILFTGSDPNIVAHIINFYLAHPEHRALLATPEAALALIEAQK